ncbi:MAG: DUF3300 domain-containing protein [Gammaproteobacteria bacterium]|nr:DUF3300 domain-containing protein [Gammaproteobacteria bacterium]
MHFQVKQFNSDAFSNKFIALITLVATLCFIPATTLAAAADVVTVEPAPLLDQTQLAELVSPVALYPDDLLAIVLPASTYPLQIVAAARFRENVANDGQEPNEDWDESVVALLNYPEALALLNDDIDWTWELGQAVLAQQSDIMIAVKDFRQEVYAKGNLETDDKQIVSIEDDTVIITPVDPEVVYVPYYEPRQVVVYQSEPVYRYYPTAYPVYYYPYPSSHHFYNDGFWGISSIFSLNWGQYNVNHYFHQNRRHRYYGRSYNRSHFRYTNRYYQPHAYQRRLSHRSLAQHGYANTDQWRPDRRHVGSHQRYQDRRHNRHSYRDQGRKHNKYKRHTQRNAQHQYAGYAENRRQRSINPRSSVHRQRTASRINTGKRLELGRAHNDRKIMRNNQANQRTVNGMLSLDNQRKQTLQRKQHNPVRAQKHDRVAKQQHPAEQQRRQIRKQQRQRSVHSQPRNVQSQHQSDRPVRKQRRVERRSEGRITRNIQQRPKVQRKSAHESKRVSNGRHEQSHARRAGHKNHSGVQRKQRAH